MIAIEIWAFRSFMTSHNVTFADMMYGLQAFGRFTWYLAADWMRQKARFCGLRWWADYTQSVWSSIGLR